MSFDVPKLTKRDYVIGWAVAASALFVLVAIVYAISVVVQHFLPVGCTP